jgi:predicted dehydrogenase
MGGGEQHPGRLATPWLACATAALRGKVGVRVRASRAKRHKLALLGLGTMGLRHARIFAGMTDRFDVVGAFDVRRDAPVPYGVVRLAGEADAIGRADVVVIATPITAHAGTAARALSAGRSVFVEKPVCATTNEADALAQVASRASGALFVGHSERFNPVVRALARLVRGDVVVSIDFRRVGPARPSDSGVLMNHGVHDLDLAAYLGAGAVELRGAVGGDDSADVLFETASGAIGHIHADRTAPARSRALTLTTPRWTYEADLLEHRLVRTARDTGVRTEVPLPLEEPLAAQARALADALDGGAAREIATLRDGAAAVGLAERASALCASTPPGALPGRLGTP